MRNRAIILLITLTAILAAESPRHFFFPTEGKSSRLNTKEQLGDQIPAGPRNEIQGFTDAPQQTFVGYIPVRDTGSSLFYILHTPTGQAIDSSGTLPLIIWLQGGPGCSSLYGDMGELGPKSITQFDPTTGKATLTTRASAWSNLGYLLAIDSPIGVGYSFSAGGDVVIDSTTTAKDLHTFMQSFYKSYPELQKNPLYITGESYAGHYIPAFAYEVFMNMSTTGIPFAGLAIGDGIVDPVNQMLTYDQYTYSNGLISEIGRENINILQNQANVLIKSGQLAQASPYWDQIMGYIIQMNPGINILNFRQYNFSSPPDYEEAWANHSATKQMLLVPSNINYVACNNDMYLNFSADIATSFVQQLEAMAGKIKIMIYSGQDDICVNTPGTDRWLMNARFPPEANVRHGRKHIWTLNGEVAGTVVHRSNFYYVIVNDAGHMVPKDNAPAALDMLNHFIQGDYDWSS